MSYCPGGGQLGALRHQLLGLPPGRWGTWVTVRHMERMVREAIRNPLLVRAARSIVLAVPSGSAPAEVAAVRRFLAERVRFTRDPLGVETLTSPARMLEDVATDGMASGDCDEVATLGAALGMALGMPARFVLYAFDPGGPWLHVFAELWDGTRWSELDTVREVQGIPPDFRPARTATVPLA